MMINALLLSLAYYFFAYIHSIFDQYFAVFMQFHIHPPRSNVT